MFNSSSSIPACAVRVTGYYFAGAPVKPSVKSPVEKIESSIVEVETSNSAHSSPTLSLVQTGLPRAASRSLLAVAILAEGHLAALLSSAHFYAFPTGASLFAHRLLAAEKFTDLSSFLEVSDKADWLLALQPLLALFAPSLWQISPLSQAQWTHQKHLSAAAAGAIHSTPESFIWPLFYGHPQELPVFLALDEHRWVQLTGDLTASTGLLLRPDVFLSSSNFKNLHLERFQREAYAAQRARILPLTALQDALCASLVSSSSSSSSSSSTSMDETDFSKKLVESILPAQFEAEDLSSLLIREMGIARYGSLQRCRIENKLHWSFSFEWQKTLFQLTFASQTGLSLDEVFLHRGHLLVRSRIRPSLRAMVRMLEEFRGVHGVGQQDAVEDALKACAPKQPSEGGLK